MSTYNCDKCSYTTNRLYNLTKHNNSKKHVTNDITKYIDLQTTGQAELEQNKNTCDICGKDFMYKQGLSKHKKSCIKNNTNQKITELKTEIENLKMINMQEQIKNLQDKVEILSGYKNIAENATEISKSSCSALNFIIKHYNDAPCIKTFTNFELLTEGNEDYSIAEIAIHKYKYNELCSYIGDIIVNEYKTQDPRKQAFWTSDVNRLAYLIREVTSSNKVEWFTDKGGVKLSKYITKPILDHMNADLTRYYDESLTNIESDINESTKKELRDKMIISKSITKLIQSNQLNDDIIKYIAKFLHLDRKPDNKAIVNDVTDE